MTRKCSPEETETRVRAIMDTMRELRWERGVSAESFSQLWGVSVSRVEELSAEAWRRVSAEVTDKDKVRPTVCTYLEASLSGAYKKGDYKAVSSLSDVYTRIVGGQAKKELEITSMGPESNKERAARIRSLAEALEEEED